MSAPDLTILINTFNRCDLLIRALHALDRQTGASQWTREIVVVDDGSEYSPRETLEREGLLEKIHLEIADHQGPSEARNRGIRLARGKFILFLGDDIIAGPNLIAAHMNLLNRKADEKIISLGHSEWKVTNISPPLYEHSQAHRFNDMIDGEGTHFRHFYTANIAMAKRAFDEVGEFDTSFTGTSWGWEDTELGFRLKQQGWRLVYNPAAWADHIHPPMTIRQMLERQVRIGVGGCRFYAKHPIAEIAEIAFMPGTRKMKSGPAWRKELGIAAASVLERVAPNSKLLEQIYRRLVFSCRTQGVEKGRELFPEANI